MPVLDIVRDKLAAARQFNGINLVLIPDRSPEGYTAWVIRQSGLQHGGLTVATLDPEFNSDKVKAILEMLTPEFFVAMQRQGYLSGGSFTIEATEQLGLKSIRIESQVPIHVAYWNHSLQCMVTKVVV